jgi:hypothetical protein
LIKTVFPLTFYVDCSDFFEFLLFFSSVPLKAHYHFNKIFLLSNTFNSFGSKLKPIYCLLFGQTSSEYFSKYHADAFRSRDLTKSAVHILVAPIGK